MLDRFTHRKPLIRGLYIYKKKNVNKHYKINTKLSIYNSIIKLKTFTSNIQE